MVPVGVRCCDRYGAVATMTVCMSTVVVCDDGQIAPRRWSAMSAIRSVDSSKLSGVERTAMSTMSVLSVDVPVDVGGTYGRYGRSVVWSVVGRSVDKMLSVGDVRLSYASTATAGQIMVRVARASARAQCRCDCNK